MCLCKRTTVRCVLTVAFLAAGCSDAGGPERLRPGRPAFVAATATGITLDQQNSALGPDGMAILKGFNPTNPHTGDAIIATFFWVGSTNIISSVTDHLANAARTPVGNNYQFVDFVTAGGISMATFVATNVQNFPDPNTAPDQSDILVVQADLSANVSDGGVILSAYTGVDPVAARALGAVSHASGSGSAATTASPGSIPVGPGALAYGFTVSNGVVGIETPAAPFQRIATPSNTVLKADAEFAVSTGAITVNPQWVWHFEQSTNPPKTWLATALALNPPPQLAFTVQPSNTTAGSTISPPVQVTAQDAAGATVTGFNGTITVALGANPGGGALSGTTSQTAMNGVATFSDLSINKVGNGYTLVAAATGLTSATSAAFNITPPPPTQLAFIVQPSNATAGGTISPPVQVAAQDGTGTTVAGFNGTITVALGANPSGGVLSGTTSMIAASGVATFSNLSIDKAGNGYTLVASAAGLTSATSAPFNITAPPPAPVNDFMTGGGKLGSGRDFATLGSEADLSSGKVTWVQHCLRGATSSTCATGQFTFKGTVTPGTYAAVPGQPRCRTWNGSGTRTNKSNPSASGTFAFTVNAACDNAQPGHGVDFIDITIDGYHNSGFLSGGNFQLHNGP
jgi:hypothetical protein